MTYFTETDLFQAVKTLIDEYGDTYITDSENDHYLKLVRLVELGCVDVRTEAETEKILRSIK